MLTTETKKPNAVRVNWWLDLALFGVLMLSLSPTLTGLVIHEWLGLSLAGGALIHLLLHWNWVVATLRRLLQKLPGLTRFSLVLNLLLFITFTVVAFTGLLISREALPFFGLTLPGGRVWEGLHRQAADLLLCLAGLHVAVHWQWILNALKRYLVNPLLKPGQQTSAAPTTSAAEVK